PVDPGTGGNERERAGEQRRDLAFPTGLHVRGPRGLELGSESDTGPRSRVRGRPDDVPGPDRGRIPRDTPSGPRAPRSPSKAGWSDRLHGGIRGLGAARGLAVPRAGAGLPRKEAITVRGLRIGGGGDRPTSSSPARSEEHTSELQSRG